MTYRQRKDWTKWITTGIAVLGVFTAALAWAISIDTQAGRVPHLESQQDSLSRDVTEIKTDVKWIRERLK